MALKIFMSKANKRFFTTVKIPAIVSDIDGVLYRGGSAVGNSTEIVPKLLKFKF